VRFALVYRCCLSIRRRDSRRRGEEGRAQQRKGEAGVEAGQRAKTEQTEKEAKGAEKERDRQRRKKKAGC
jgi:hypothetical protein